MGERTRYAPGTFCSVDLGTADAAAAKRFYAGLFGWEAEDVPAPPGGTYTGLFERPADAGPPAWASYVAVEDADATARRAQELGGSVARGPFDIGDVGRMAVLADPQGAHFCLWQPGSYAGASLVNEAGALCWNQLTTPEPRAAAPFYEGLFGWRVEETAGSGGQYFTVYNGEAVNAGAMPTPPGAEGVPPHWLVYFGHDDLDAAAARIGELGGGVQMGPVEVPAGRFLVAHDPQGAWFGLFEGDFDP